MKKWVKTTLKTSIITIISIIGLVIIVSSLFLYIVLTPKRLTPIVESIASEYIDANLKFNEVELTVFSTFPKIGVRLKDGLLQSKNQDSLPLTDTIVSFSSANIVFSPLKLIFENRISVSEIKLETPNIYAYTDTLGKANWDVFKFDSSESDTSKFDMTLNLDKFSLQNGKVTYDDRKSHIFGRVKNVTINLSGNMDKRSNVKMNAKLDSALFWEDGAVLAKKLNIEVIFDANNDPNLRRLFVNEMCVKLNDLDVDFDGWIGRDSVKIHASAQTKSIKEILNLIPEKYLKVKRKIDTKGELNIDLNLYSPTKFETIPPFNIALELKNGALQYEGFVYGIDDIDTKVGAYIDLSNKTKSTLQIEQFDLSATAVKMTLQGSVDDLLGNPKFNATADVDVDFETLAKTIPFKEQLEITGDMCFNGKFISNLKDVQDIKWYNFNATGDLILDNISLVSLGRHFSFINSHTSVKLETNKVGHTAISGQLGNIIILKEGFYDARLKDGYISVTAERIKDSIANLVGKIGYTGLSLALPKDSVILTSSASDVQVELNDWIKLKFKTDTLGVDMMQSRAVLDSAHVDARFALKGKRRMGGVVEFKDLDVKSNYFPLPIHIGSTKLSLKRDIVDLSKVQVRVGSSQFQISGTAEGIFRSIRSTDEVVKVKGLLVSKNIDLNELMYASYTLPFMQDDSITVEQAEATDNFESPLFAIPKNIQANLTVNLDTLKYTDIVLNNTRGGIQIEDQKLRVRRVVSHFEGSQIALRGFYDTSIADSADLTFSVEAKDIDVKKVTTLFPYLDSITPIIRSVYGMVDFDMVAKTEFYKSLNVDLAKLNASVMVTAQKVEIPDNETLSSVAKMLMFKNKKVTKLDSVSMQMVVGNGVVDIFPFILDIDRYRVALGGKQALEGDMDYHVSVLKSPIPIKFGVNITGNFEDFNIGIGKTRYKYLQGADYKDYINPDYTKKRDSLFAPLVVRRKNE